MELEPTGSPASISSLNSAPLPRSAYADKLFAFSDFVFTDCAAFQQHGTWKNFFCRRIGSAFDGRLILEIGCHDASFLSRIASRFHGAAFVGLDWKCKPLYDGASRIAGLGLNNVVLLRARAQDLSWIFAGNEVDEVWIFHPEPHDVNYQSRLINETLLIDLHRILRGGPSTLAFKTDEPECFRSTLDLFAASKIVRDGFELAISSTDYWRDPAALVHSSSRCFSGEVTSYERRFIKRGIPIHYFEMRKKSCQSVVPDRLPLGKPPSP